ncbi:MAG: hypothetical protein JW999_04340 [Methanotrichaceae archaeon]|nr:hypothetical protein [Methanotrichaceae archaeon]
MSINYRTRLDGAKSLPDIFELVKSLVLKSMGKSRGGLMLGMANLGNHPQGFFGGFFTTGTNVIVLNKIPLERIKETRPELYKPYVFHVLLHEYIHSLGYLDEADVKSKVFEITKEALGEEHLATQMAANASEFIKHLAYPDVAWKAEDTGLELVQGFDRSSVSYIA